MSHSASHHSSKQNVYPAHFKFIGFPVDLDTVAVGGPLMSEKMAALIGRDVRRHFTLHYNGLAGQVTLAI